MLLASRSTTRHYGGPQQQDISKHNRAQKAEDWNRNKRLGRVERKHHAQNSELEKEQKTERDKAYIENLRGELKILVCNRQLDNTNLFRFLLV